MYRLLTLFVVLAFSSCSVDQPTAPRLTYSGSWSVGWPQVGHDGTTIETEHFICYTNYAGRAARERVLAIAETSYAASMALLQLDGSEFTWLPSYPVRKIHIHVDTGEQPSGGVAYRDGFIVRASDSPRFNYTPDGYRNLVHHEMNHVFEFLLIGDFTYRQANTVWFREGFASWAAGIHTVTTVQQLDDWMSLMADVQGAGNPILIYRWTNFPPTHNSPQATGTYYPFFELAVRYLLDPLGQGRSIDDLKGFYNDLGAGAGISPAFSGRFGMTLEFYQENFFSLMRGYLEKVERGG